ncbi:hypothetical protein [Glutamicibacter protophormiae]|uniref:hypothetical protein n=1 Tax=Glutamicibacter protophormiae TaxID=37930 RepID=UPI0036201D33
MAYRKQRDAEEGRFVERFGAAAEQLGHVDVAVRMAGVYAMAGVADRTRNMEQRQQCVDVLCGYLRLPYDPTSIEDHQVLTIVRNPEREGTSTSREIHFQYRQNDREVRNTIVRIISDHLRRDDSQSWSQCSFDFKNVFFDNANFSGARFDGSITSFEGATFGGAFTSFALVAFGSRRSSFVEATFDANRTLFTGATFDGHLLCLISQSSAGNQRCLRGEVGGGETSFDRAM